MRATGPSRRRLLQGGLAAAAAAAGRYALGTVSAADRSASAAPGGFRPGGLDAVDAIVEAGVAARAFPGGVLAVGLDGALVHSRAFGRLSYDPDAAAVATDTLYDLASLTKVVVTTTLSMILVDEGKLDLDARVHGFFPAFSGPAKESVTVRHLLTHSGGLQWWAPLYKEVKGKKAYIERIVAMDLAYEPGAKTVYSDLGIILLGDILERVSGTPFEELAQKRVLQPLAMKDSRYRPPAALLDRIAPTENDPWRGRVVRGEVHDENALALGGVAPHAGLFATAPDLAHLAQALLDGGVFGGRRIVSRATVELFTERAGIPVSSRALGWDTPTDESGQRSSTPGQPGYSSAGSLFSARSFGHTGFTGTSMWMDPERELYVILLTNRVHPTRENNKIRDTRAQVADAVVRGLGRP
ncbi:MAG TPA: serine hydrolase domain-containing protein [Vicinamibacteria bacterium]|nr:serine hydrolase domain-containing protein [Vicinamibacteria bacterium]